MRSSRVAGLVFLATFTLAQQQQPVDLNLTDPTRSARNNIKRAPGEIDWVPAGVRHTLTNNSLKPAQFVFLEFNPEKQNQ